MNVRNVRIGKERKKLLASKWICGIFLILWVLSLGLTLKAIMTPQNVSEKVIENKIKQQTTLEYKIDVVPSLLFPKGGTITPDNVIFTNISENLRIHIDSKVLAEQPVTIRGTQKVTLKLINDKVWEREFKVYPETTFSLKGTENNLGGGDLVINLKDVSGYIKKVEEETRSSGRYLLLVKPEFNGEIVFQDKKVLLDLNPQLQFEYNGSTLKLTEEVEKGQSSGQDSSAPGTKSTSNETTIESTKVTPQSFQIFNAKMSIGTAKLTFGSMSGLLTLLLVSVLGRRIRLKGSTLSEIECIDKKFQKRLLYLEDQLCASTIVRVSQFKSLLSIADDKEEMILRYENDENVIYAVAVQGYVYCYPCVRNRNILRTKPPLLGGETLSC